MKTKIVRLLLAVVVRRLCWPGGAWFSGWPAVRGTTAGDTLTLYGNVDIRQVQLAFNGSERMSDSLAGGDRVRKGHLLASLDTARLEHAAGRQAQVAAQQQVVERLGPAPGPRRSARRAPTWTPRRPRRQRRAHQPARSPSWRRKKSSAQEQARQRPRRRAMRPRRGCEAAAGGAAPGRRRPAQGGHRRRPGRRCRPTGRSWPWRSASWPTPTSTPRRRRDPATASSSRATWPPRSGRSTRWP